MKSGAGPKLGETVVLAVLLRLFQAFSRSSVGGFELGGWTVLRLVGLFWPRFEFPGSAFLGFE